MTIRFFKKEIKMIKYKIERKEKLIREIIRTNSTNGYYSYINFYIGITNRMRWDIRKNKDRGAIYTIDINSIYSEKEEDIKIRLNNIENIFSPQEIKYTLK
jgi:hypothetical protein